MILKVVLGLSLVTIGLFMSVAVGLQGGGRDWGMGLPILLTGVVLLLRAAWESYTEASE